MPVAPTTRAVGCGEVSIPSTIGRPGNRPCRESSGREDPVGRRSGLDRGIVDSVTWLGHSTVLLEIAGTRLLTDPLLRPHAGVLRRRTPRPTEEHWREVDAVLLSHLHHDHAHLRSLRELGPVPILTGRENATWLRARKHSAPQLAELQGLKLGASGRWRTRAVSQATRNFWIP